MKFLYGTAWKEERTEDCVSRALTAGFRGFDTANQRKHYYEEGVGQALAKAIASGSVTRAQLFIQTKFTYRDGQDHRLPYDPAAPVAEQVRQSVASSLRHLGTDYLDAYLIHGPQTRAGLTADDWAVWRVMEELHGESCLRQIGVSNVSPAQIEALAAKARVQPSFVQNRCYTSIAWDRSSRAVCRRLGIVYQGFNLIRDPLVLQSAEVAKIAERHGKTVPQVIYRFAFQDGMLPLTGTTSTQHMAEALASSTFAFSAEECALIEAL